MTKKSTNEANEKYFVNKEQITNVLWLEIPLKVYIINVSNFNLIFFIEQ